MKSILLTLLVFPKLLFALRALIVSDFSAPMPAHYTSCKELPLFYRVKFALEKEGIECFEGDVKKQKKFDRVIFWNYPKVNKPALRKTPKEKMVLFVWEPPTVQSRLHQKRFHTRFSKVYTWDDALVDNKKYFKFYYPVLNPMGSNLPIFENKKLCTQIITNKKSKHPNELYSQRKQIIQAFERQPELGFEFYGYGWKGEQFPSYRGTVDDKIGTLARYRFAICYENMTGVEGYITEKIFDCFAAGTVPVYWGATNVDSYIPKECFIDRRAYKSDEELITHLQTISKIEYEKYLLHIRNFLKSEKAYIFSFENFKKTLSEAISE